MSDFTVGDLDTEKELKFKPNPFGEYKPETFWEDYGKKYRSYFEVTEDSKSPSSIILNIKDLIARIYLLKPLSILEIGCGFGRIFPSIVENLNLDAYGIEFSNTMIEQSVDYYKDYPQKNRIHIQYGRAQEIPHANKSFELVYSHACLTHIPPKDIPLVVSEIDRVASKYIIHIERFWYPYEHSHPHHWSHLLAPLYIAKGWEMIENTPIHTKHFTNILVLKRGE